ncbi:hypothetical protein ACFFX0_14025 [Citricoccus parietis]|uniref:Uncharacterized protein n=1 Tax=Citricoccus parietis TaxID=592307 RepID=A0ABV5FZZ0_9MICC
MPRRRPPSRSRTGRRRLAPRPGRSSRPGPAARRRPWPSWPRGGGRDVGGGCSSRWSWFCRCGVEVLVGVRRRQVRCRSRARGPWRGRPGCVRDGGCRRSGLGSPPRRSPLGP